MKILKEKAKIIAFFSTMPLEFGGGAEILTIQTAKILSEKKNTKIIIYAPKKDLFTKKNRLKAVSEVIQYGTVITEPPRYTQEELKVLLGKVDYKKLGFWKLLKKIRNADYLITRSDIPSLLPIFIAFLSNPILRKKVLIQFHTPVRYNESATTRARVHNLIYTSLFYRWFVYLLSYKLQVLNSRDKRYFRGARLIKVPCDDMFFTSEKGNRHIGKRKHIIIAGRLTYQKGIDMLPSLLEYLKRKRVLDQFRFTVAGSGDMQDIIIKCQKRYKDIQYVKNIDHRKMPLLLSKGNIFLMLSRWEGSPITLAEAMAMGLLIVAFNIPGIYSKKSKKIIRYADAYDIKQLAQHLIETLSVKRTVLKEQSDATIQYAQTQYKMSSYIKKLENLLYSDH